MEGALAAAPAAGQAAGLRAPPSGSITGPMRVLGFMTGNLARRRRHGGAGDRWRNHPRIWPGRRAQALGSHPPGGCWMRRTRPAPGSAARRSRRSSPKRPGRWPTNISRPAKASSPNMAWGGPTSTSSACMARPSCTSVPRPAGSAAPSSWATGSGWPAARAAQWPSIFALPMWPRAGRGRRSRRSTTPPGRGRLGWRRRRPC